MASKYKPTIEELRQGLQNLMTLWGALGTHQVRVPAASAHERAVL